MKAGPGDSESDKVSSGTGPDTRRFRISDQQLAFIKDSSFLAENIVRVKWPHREAM